MFLYVDVEKKTPPTYSEHLLKFDFGMTLEAWRWYSVSEYFLKGHSNLPSGD